MLHTSSNHQENNWKITQLPSAIQPNHGLPVILDEYNLCNLLGYNGKYPWFIVHKPEDNYSTFWIDKDTKRIVPEFNEALNLREISAPTAALKELQGRLAALIFSKLPKRDCNFAYMSGKNIREAAETQVDGDILIRIDLKNFFGSHLEPYVRAKLHEITGYSKELCWFITKLCSLKGCLPQGSVASPMLSIILNTDMDDRITAIANAHNLVYARYADDLCFSGSERSDVEANSFVEEIADIIHPFQVNWDKVDIMRNETRSYVCGIEVRGNVAEVAEPVLSIINAYNLDYKQVTGKLVITTKRGPIMSDVYSLIADEYKDYTVKPKSFYMQSIKRMLGMHLTDGVHYPRAKYNDMRMKAMLVAKGAPNIDARKFKGQLAFMRMVDAPKAEKIDQVLTKHRHVV